MIRKLLRSELIKNSFIFTTANIINAAIPFLLLPILTRLLSPSDYAIVSILQISISISTILIGLNAHGAINVNYFKISQENLKKYVGSVFTILITSFLLFLLLIFLSKNLLSGLLQVPGNWVLIVAVIGFFQFITTSNLVIWQAEKKSIPYGILQIAQTILNIAFSVLFVVTFGLNWRGRILGILIATIIIALISLFILYKKGYLKINKNKEYIIDALKFGIPLIPHSIGNWMMTYIDRFFIIHIISLAAAGLYSVGYQFGMIIGLVAMSFNKAWVPYLYERLEKNNDPSKKSIVKITYLFFAAIIILASFVSLISPWLVHTFVSEEFWGSIAYIPWITFGYAFLGMYYMVTNYIFYIKKTHILAWVTFSSAILNIILNYILINRYGALGAAHATFFTNLVFFIAVWILTSRTYKMPWNPIHAFKTN